MSEVTDTRPGRGAGGLRRLREAPRAEKISHLDPHLISLAAPASFEADQYRMLRSRLETREEGAATQVVAVTSAAVGDGKTTTAINLAGALAQSRDVRVLLIDADLRRPSVAPLLGLDDAGGPGLADAILDPDLTLESTVRGRVPPNLEVVTAGRTPAAPYEVLKSDRLGALFDEARRLYDYVVVDTPPLIPVPDSRLIARRVDGLLLVVAAHRTPRKLVEESLNLLEPDRLIGLVFNGDLRGTRYYGYDHGYGRPSRRIRGNPLGTLGDPLIDGPRRLT